MAGAEEEVVEDRGQPGHSGLARAPRCQRHPAAFRVRLQAVDADRRRDIFLHISEEEHRDYMMQEARKQGNYVRDGEAVEVKHCMTSLGYKRFLAYQKVYEARRQEGETDTGQVFLCDISQNIASRCRHGAVLPAVCTSSVFYSFSSERFVLPAELASSQGWPRPSCSTYGDLTHHRDVRSASGTGSTVPGQRRRLSMQRRVFGNGQHLAHVGQVFLYIASFTMRLETAASLCPVPRPLDSSEDGADLEGL